MHGQRTDYLRRPRRWRRFDPALFDFLADEVLVAGHRDITLFEHSGLLPQSLFYSGILADPPDERAAYFRQAWKTLKLADIVFFDPDNGLEVPSVRYGTAGSERYLYWKEVETTWNAGHSLLIFQHFTRQERRDFTTRLLTELQARTIESRVAAVATKHALFLLSAQQAHFERLGSALKLISQRWAGEVAITPEAAGRQLA
jgi:hypothetical protein